MRMKYITYILLAMVLAILATSTSFAYNYMSDEENKYKLKSKYIYMLYHKLIGKKPDFRTWIEGTDEYKNAGRLKKLEMINEQVAEMEDDFIALDVKEPIDISFKTEISPYSTKNHGFFIDSLQPDLFFSYEYMGKNIALIPKNIENYQWFSIPPVDIEEIDMDLSKTNKITLRITLMPKYADDGDPIYLGRKKYWLILAKVINIELWSDDNSQLLWRGKTIAEDNELLDLYK